MNTKLKMDPWTICSAEEAFKKDPLGIIRSVKCYNVYRFVEENKDDFVVINLVTGYVVKMKKDAKVNMASSSSLTVSF